MGVCGGSNLRRDMYESWARTPVSSAAHAPCLQTRQFSQRVRVPCISRSHRLRPSRVTPAKFARKRTLSIPAALHEVGSCRLGTTANPPTTGILRNRPRFRFRPQALVPFSGWLNSFRHGAAALTRRSRKATARACTWARPCVRARLCSSRCVRRLARQSRSGRNRWFHGSSRYPTR